MAREQSRQILIPWVKHLPKGESQEDFTKLLRNSTLVLGRLRILLEELEHKIERTERSFKAYEDPNWDVRQAHKNGYMHALDQVKELLSFIPTNYNKD